MKIKSSKLMNSVVSPISVITVGLLLLLAGINIAAQDQTTNSQPLITESQKNDRSEALREELDQLDQLITRQPQNPAALQMRAERLLELKRYEEAIADYSHLIALQPDYLPTFLDRALCYQQLEQYEQALEDANEVIRRTALPDQTHNSDDVYKAYLMRYLIHSEIKQMHEAISDLTAMLKLRPNDEAIYQMRSDAYKTSGQYEKAIADYTRLIKINPRSTWGYLGRAEVYKLRGERRKAAAEMKAVKLLVKKRGF